MDPLKPLIDNLNAEGRPRIWSLVITVFGDSVQHRGGRIATARLSRLLGRIGVETGAVRTALSRLSQDGWVEGKRSGRTSSYTLTDRGLQEFGPATARIYAPPRQRPVGEWVFDWPGVEGALRLGQGSLRPAPVTDTPGGLRMTGTLTGDAGAQVRASLDPDHAVALERMAQDLTALSGIDASPLDAAAARLLQVHRWRRLVLRWPEVPAELMPEDAAPRDLRRAMAEAYKHLAPAAEAWLDTADGEMPAMPPAGPDFSLRFGGLQTP